MCSAVRFIETRKCWREKLKKVRSWETWTKYLRGTVSLYKLAHVRLIEYPLFKLARQCTVPYFTLTHITYPHTVFPCRPFLIFPSHYSVTSTRKILSSSNNSLPRYNMRSTYPAQLIFLSNAGPIKRPSPNEDRTTNGGTAPHINLSTRQKKMWAFSSGYITSAAICA